MRQGFLRRAALLAGTLALVAGAPAAASAAEAAAAPFITGAGTHFAQGVPNPAATLRLAAQAGMTSIRDEVYWNAVEREPGRLAMPAAWDDYVEDAVRAGLSPLLILDYGNPLYDHGDKPRSPAAIAAFTRYAAFVARHFRGKVKRYEVWNEWDNAGGGTTPGSMEDYARLLKPVYSALKAVDPDLLVLADAVVMGKGREGDFQKMAQLGLLRDADGISVHPYFYNRGPRKTPEAWAGWMQGTEAALSRHNDGAAVPLYVTEIGWPSYAGRDGVSLRRQAAYAARLLLLARTMPFIKGLWWYDFRNDGEDPAALEQNFGLIWPDLTPKPAYYALAAVTRALAGTSFAGRTATADGEDWLLRFRDPDGSQLWALWTARADTLSRFDLATLRERPGRVAMREAGRPAIERAWVAGPRGSWHLEVTAGATPVLLQGDLSDITAGTLHRNFPDDGR